MDMALKIPENTQCIEGAAGTGKTQRLVEQAVELSQAGAQPEDVLVLVSSPAAIGPFRRRLADQLPEFGARASIATAQSLALRVLGTEKARIHYGREGRLLLPFERTILLEDLKNTGIAPRRLREMLRFFERCFTELADEDEGWLFNDEERLVCGALESHLDALGAYLASQVANRAYRFLCSHGEELGRFSKPYVLVDDASLQNGSSQALACLCAQDLLVVAGDPDATQAVFDDYPCQEGFSALMALPGVSVRRLAECFCCKAASIMRGNLSASRDGADVEPADPGIRLERYDGPVDELRGVVSHVRRCIDDGVPPSRIYLATQSAAVRRGAKNALDQAGIKASLLESARSLSSDERDHACCARARLLVALELASCPKSYRAWRSWCAFGDHLLNSPAFEFVLDQANAHGTTPLEELRAIVANVDATGPEEVYGTRHVAEAVRQADAIVEKTAGLAGEALLDAVAALLDVDGKGDARKALAWTKALLGGISPDEDAASLVRRIRGQLVEPSFDDGAVRIGSFEQLSGQDLFVLLLPAFANGYFPSADYLDASKSTIEQREKMRARDYRLMLTVLGKARKEVAVSYFALASLSLAGSLRFAPHRIILRGGEQCACIAPSDFAALSGLPS